MGLRSAGRKLSFEILDDGSSNGEDEPRLYRSKSDSIRIQDGTAEQSQSSNSVSHSKSSRKKRKQKTSKKRKVIESCIPEDPIAEQESINLNSISADFSDPHSSSENREGIVNNGATCCVNGYELNSNRYYTVGTVVCEEVRAPEESKTSVCSVAHVTETEFQGALGGEGFNFGELRLRAVNGGGCEDLGFSMVDGNGKDDSVAKASSVEKQRNGSNGNVVTKLETAESLDWNRLMAEDPNCE